MKLVTDTLGNVSNMIKDSGSILEPLNNLLQHPLIIFPVLVMLQGTQGGRGVALVPEKIANLANTPVTRMIMLSLVGFAATGNLALAVVGAFAFAVILYLLRSSEEKDAAPMF